MAQLNINGTIYDLENGARIESVCRKAGLSFNCSAGVCGSCLVTIVAGQEWLSAATPEEEALGIGDKQRLACQCSITSGTVAIKF